MYSESQAFAKLSEGVFGKDGLAEEASRIC